MNRTQASSASEDSANRSTASFGEMLLGTSPDQEINLSGPGGVLIRLSKVQEVDPYSLFPNPANNRPMPSKSRLEKMGTKMSQVGILHNLIIRRFQAGDPGKKEREYTIISDGKEIPKEYSDVIICGHVRRECALNYAKLNSVPVRRIISPHFVSRELELFLFDVENDDRRNDRENFNEKLDWVRTHFGEKIATRKKGRGGARRGKNKEANLPKEIEEQSQGDIPAGTAKRYIQIIEEELGEVKAKAARKSDPISGLFKEARETSNWLKKHDPSFVETHLQTLVEKFQARKEKIEAREKP